jgi:hypothetical protein
MVVVYGVLNAGKVELEVDLVNGDLLLASKVLQNGREEGLREEETREPEDGRGCTYLDPLEEGHYAKVQVFDVAGKRLQGWVRNLHPGVWYKSSDKLCLGDTELLTHQYLSLLCCSQLIESLHNQSVESIELADFLVQE